MTRSEKLQTMVLWIPQRYNEWLAKLPSTNFKIQWTVAAMMLTTLRYVASDIVIGPIIIKPWEPDTDWLAFMVAMAAVDSWQFGKKRDSINKELSTKQNQEKSNVDRPTEEA